jgi:hypothetical protein
MNTSIGSENYIFDTVWEKNLRYDSFHMRGHRSIKDFFHHLIFIISYIIFKNWVSNLVLPKLKIKLESVFEIVSSAARELFVVLVEWILFEHVEFQVGKVERFAIQTDEDDDLDMFGYKKERSIFTISYTGKKTDWDEMKN